MGDGMGVECDLCVSGVDRERFYAVDYQVMRIAFDIHNQLGRFCDERIYQEELLNRCKASGLAAEREVRLRVSYRSFTKSYYMDAVVENGVVYELKTTDDLNNNKHLQRLLSHTDLEKMHWFNLDKKNLTIITLARRNVNASILNHPAVKSSCRASSSTNNPAVKSSCHPTTSMEP